MEYVKGKQIDVYCDEHRLSVNERLRLLEAVFSAIRYAHEKHVVHRDLSPDNILVTTDGVVKLLDFGIAKLLPGAEVTISLTRTNLLAMTPEYASPEQIRREVVTPLSDVYSLGTLAYELLTGRRPYRLRTRIFHEIARVIRAKARPRLKYEAGFKRIFAVLAVCWVAYYLRRGIAVIVRGGYIDVGFLVSRFGGGRYRAGLGLHLLLWSRSLDHGGLQEQAMRR
jgi:serine/threonine protein kinase